MRGDTTPKKHFYFRLITQTHWLASSRTTQLSGSSAARSHHTPPSQQPTK
ncbi:hypothetical protein RP20_CCG019616 [Aedes albopictus]|nr:hypothetical protein RP20_CCG019616 [Aedes albopictus]